MPAQWSPRTDLRDLHIIARPPRFTPRHPRETEWCGRVVAIDTEGSADTGRYTATAQWDDLTGAVYARRFTKPDEFAEWLIALHADSRSPILVYCHNLEWDMQVLDRWCGFRRPRTRLRYHEHIARRNGSALQLTLDYTGRLNSRRMIHVRDSFAVWPLSLRELGKTVAMPKLRTPRAYIPHVVNWQTGERIEPRDDYADDAPACDEHGRDECTDCYDMRDAAILHAAMRLYVDSCNEAQISPSLTRSAHAMKDYRTNFLAEPMHQYTERENLRALSARYGGRTQMLANGLVTAEPDEVIMQADVVSMYPSIMARGEFPDAGKHRVLYWPKASRLNDYVGWAWADVQIPDLPLGPLVYRDDNGRTAYPVNCTLQGAWTTDELAYAVRLGCTVTVVRLEGTLRSLAVDPFSAFIADKYARRARHKSEGNPLQLADKLDMNGLYGKFGMRWTDEIVHFIAAPNDDIEAYLHDVPYRADPQLPTRYPDYLMVPWASLILARARIELHRFGTVLHGLGARLLTCDTDSWTFVIRSSALDPSLFGSKLGDWELEPLKYVAFRGAAPKEYALYSDAREVFAGEPYKARAKGIGGLYGDATERSRAIDHYLRVGNIHFQRPQKTRSVIRGAASATFVHVEKSRHARASVAIPDRMCRGEFAAYVKDEIEAAEARRLWNQRRNAPDVSVRSVPA